MPKDISLGLNEVLTAQDSILINDTALANAGDLVSSVARIGQTLAGVQLNLVTETGATLVGTLTMKVETSATSGGSFVEQGQVVLPIGTVMTAGKTATAFVFPRELKGQLYTKVTLTTSGADQAVKVSLVTAFV